MEKEQNIPEKEKSKSSDFTGKFVDFIFSNDERKWLILIFILGVILRFIVAKNISLLGDEAVHGAHIPGFLGAGLISTFVHSPLWLMIGDFFLKFLGITVFSLRFTSFFYSSLSILVVYLIAARIFSKQIALLSSFLLAVSFFTIRYTLMEMDLSCMFFLLIAVYFFIDSLEDNKFPWFAAVCIGLAALIKTLSLFFVPAFIIGFFLFSKKAEGQSNRLHTKKIIIKIILFGLIVLVLFSPVLAHNYFWCKDKGMVDVYFAKYFKDFKSVTGFPKCFDLEKANAAYGMQSGYETTFEHSRFLEGIITMSKSLFTLDPIIVALGLLGIILVYLIRDKRNYWWFLLSFNVFGFVFLVLTDWLQTHFTTLIPVFCIFGGLFINNLSEVLSKKFNITYKSLITIFILIILIFQLYLLFPHLTSTCAMSQARNYAVSSMDKNSLVLTDSRIYTGRVAILFNDFHYLDASMFYSLLDLSKNSSNLVPVKLYYLECARDDCGWGTVKDNPSLQNIMEQFTAQFSQIPVEKTFLGGGGYDEEAGQLYFKLYSTVVNLDYSWIPLADSTHYWWYYPINYQPKNKIFDTYNLLNSFDSLLYLIMRLILWISLVIALVLPFYIAYRLFKTP